MNQFDVYTVNLKPAVIISPNVMNKHLSTVIIAPLTHAIKGYPCRVPSQFGGEPGEIALDQQRAVDKTRLIQKKGRIDTSTAANVKAVLATMFS